MPPSPPQVSLPRTRLGQTGLELSRLGFGCVRLTTHATERDAIEILEHAYAQGITHFDVARVYGFGHAETILGKFLRGKRERITVATKFGLAPPAGLARSRLAVTLAKRLLGSFPGVLQRLKRYGSSRVVQGAFSPQMAVNSLESSLRALGTDYVDLFLLHEATVEQALDPVLAEALAAEVRKGKVRAVGVASSIDKFAGGIPSLPTSYQLLQVENNPMVRAVAPIRSSGLALITHSAFAPASVLRRYMAAHPAARDDFSARLGVDLRDPKELTSLLLHYALGANPEGVVLFSSQDRAHVSDNVRLAASPRPAPFSPEVFEQLADSVTNFLPRVVSGVASDERSQPI